MVGAKTLALYIASTAAVLYVVMVKKGLHKADITGRGRPTPMVP
jgi:hypothetical protein